MLLFWFLLLLQQFNLDWCCLMLIWVWGGCLLEVLSVVVIVLLVWLLVPIDLLFNDVVCFVATELHWVLTYWFSLWFQLFGFSIVSVLFYFAACFIWILCIDLLEVCFGCLIWVATLAIIFIFVFGDGIVVLLLVLDLFRVVCCSVRVCMLCLGYLVFVACFRLCLFAGGFC